MNPKKTPSKAKSSEYDTFAAAARKIFNLPAAQVEKIKAKTPPIEREVASRPGKKPRAK